MYSENLIKQNFLFVRDLCISDGSLKDTEMFKAVKNYPVLFADIWKLLKNVSKKTTLETHSLMLDKVKSMTTKTFSQYMPQQKFVKPDLQKWDLVMKTRSLELSDEGKSCVFERNVGSLLCFDRI